jgi:hypothetical protein
MTQAQSAEEKARLKKQWTDLAVKQAQDGLWGEAVSTNKNILSLFPQEPDAYNRLGKALLELGQYSEARQAYAQTLKFRPDNTIAKKNLERLEKLSEELVSSHAADRIDANLFIEETGKTGMTDLINVAPSSLLAHVSIGDRLQLHVSGHSLLVRNAAGEDIGQIEPRLANRLIQFITSGNRYAAAILSMEAEKRHVRLIIREEYQHPSMFGKVSFPSHGGGDTIRAYTKESMLRYDRDDEDELGSDDEYYDGGDDGEEMTEVDFDSGLDSEE